MCPQYGQLSLNFGQNLVSTVLPRLPSTLRKNPHMPLENVFPTPYSQKNQEMWLGVQLRWVLVSGRDEIVIGWRPTTGVLFEQLRESVREEIVIG